MSIELTTGLAALLAYFFRDISMEGYYDMEPHAVFKACTSGNKALGGSLWYCVLKSIVHASDDCMAIASKSSSLTF